MHKIIAFNNLDKWLKLPYGCIPNSIMSDFKSALYLAKKDYMVLFYLGDNLKDDIEFFKECKSISDECILFANYWIYCELH